LLEAAIYIREDVESILTSRPQLKKFWKTDS